MKFSTIISTALLGVVSAAPAEEAQALEQRQGGPASGCYPHQDPHCCINYAVCQCANGWYYQWNPDSYNAGKNGCDPPWGILAKSNSGLPGWCC